MTKLIVSLDNLDEGKIKELISLISEECSDFSQDIIFKFNDMLALYGFEGIEKMMCEIAPNASLMLDPKWHDIPQTLENYIRQLAQHPISKRTEYITLHASNGYEGCKAGVDKKNELGLKTKILAVTALTSLEEKGVQAIFDDTAKHAVLKLAGEALRAGVDGIVCSPLEVEVLREVYGEDFVIVNPGVRFADGEHHDQKRVLTPKLTIENGSTDIVMGRPIIGTEEKPYSPEEIFAAVKRFFHETMGVEYQGNQGKYEFERLLYTGSWKDILSYIGAFYIRPEGGKYCRLTSGLISNAYVNIGTIERNYLVMEKAARELAGKIKEQGIQADLVMGAQMGSVRSSLVLAEKLGIEESIYTEKSGSNNEEMALKRHDITLTGRKVVISEDIVTKGSTLAKMKKMITDAGGEVVAIACVGNRFGEENFEGVPLVSCYTPEAFEMYWDETTLQKFRENEAQAGKTQQEIETIVSDIQTQKPKLPTGSKIAEKPKNEWDDLVKSMR